MLVSKNILLTRPLMQNSKLSKVLRTIGHQTLEVPLIEIAPLENQSAFNGLAIKIDQFDDFVFISQHAVQHGVHLLRDNKEFLKPEHRIIAVGQRTAAELSKDFKQVFFPDDGTGGDAVMATEEMSELQGRKILILRGQDGKSWMGDEMQRRGADVNYFDCYTRQKPKYLQADLGRVLRAIEVHLVFLHSAHAAQNLLESGRKLRKDLLLMTAIVGSEAIKGVLVDMGWKGRILTADSPSNDDMLACFSQMEDLA